MKKIFISAPWFYPAYKAGGPIQSIVNLVNNFDELVEYRIFTSNKDLDAAKLDNIESDKWISFNKVAGVFYADEPAKHLKQEFVDAHPPVLYIIGLFDWNFNIRPLFFCKAPLKLLSVRGMLHPGALSQKRRKKGIFIFFMKLSGVHKKIIFHATDETEKSHVQAVFGNQVKVSVAANFPNFLVPEKKAEKVPGTLRLITIALISPMKNHLLVLEALMKVKEEIIYKIYGPVKELAYWNLCLQKISGLPSNISVHYEGDISPAAIPGALHQSDIFIMPSKSENYGHSIAEALSAGVPVITSHHTPWNNLEVSRAGMNVAEAAAEVAEAISFFATMQEAEITEWSSSAAGYVRLRVDLDKIREQYRQLFQLAETNHEIQLPV